MILSMTEGKRNDSKNWTSSLSLASDRQPICLNQIFRCQEKEKVDSGSMKINFSKRSHQHKTKSTNYKEKEDFDSNKLKPLKNNHVLQVNQRHIPQFGKRKFSHYPKENDNEFNVEPSLPIVRADEVCQEVRMVQQPKLQIQRQVNNNSAKVPPIEREEQTSNPFLTAREQLIVDQKKAGKFSRTSGKDSISSSSYGSSSKKSLGTRRGVNTKFVPPVHNQDKDEKMEYNSNGKSGATLDSQYENCEWMKNIDPKMIELIENEIMEHGPNVSWDDIAGLDFAKNTIQEIVIWPMLRPDIFTGLRGPPKGLLLFGPPGTGKTLIGKCIASHSNATFFSISASSLTSKWIGEGEKMVRALFGVARCQQPAVIFIDEIDSLLTQRSDSEHESSRRIKTEFLVQLDGATCSSDDRILVVGATNRPQELDEAARRRLVKRLYIPLPESKARKQIIENLMSRQSNNLSDSDLDSITNKTGGFSGADMANLCREAALGPIRSIHDIKNINADDVRPVTFQDFEIALKFVRPSVSQNDLNVYVDWNRQYGSGGELI